ncbi:MAG TPA: LPS export ABC transporter permease LptG [Thermoanaerobaculia bacterium]|nr:LPS export ABC transporter permease LptG [Thermoanaerobaculia bacterium]
MNTLSRYILKEMIGPTLLGFAFYTSIILMQKLFDMAEVIIRRSLTGDVVGKLLLLSLPHIIVLTVPMSLLFGVLIAVGRLSSDSEIIAMRALGISTRTIYRPVFIFSFAMFLLNLYLINVVMPKGNRALQDVRAELLTSSAEKDIKPRLFYDEYPNLMIYVNDVDPESGEWRGVFVSDSRSATSPEATTPADVIREAAADREADQAGVLAQRGGQRIIVADAGRLAIQRPSKQVWMDLRGAETHVWDPRRADRYDLNRNESQRRLVADTGSKDLPAGAMARSLREMNLQELFAQSRALEGVDSYTYNLAQVEIHKKFALPFACIAFGILGLPLGITNRRGGKSSGFSLSIGIILFYYVMIDNGEQLAASGAVPPAVGMWAANVILLVAGIYLLIRANRDIGARSTGGGVVNRAISGLRHLMMSLRRRKSRGRNAEDDDPSLLSRLDITFPNILDRYILREFLKILLLVILSVMALFVIVEYTEMAGAARDNQIPAGTIISYFRFFMFQVLHWTLPISVLVATLVTFGMLSRNNEVTALKSGGVSLYRVALPIVVVAAAISAVSYLNLDFVLPYTTQRATKMKSIIKGRTPVASTAQEQKLWVYGQGRYLMNFLAYDRNREELTQVQVFEFHPTRFRLTRRVYANHAKWNGRAWVFSDGWVRSFTESGTSTYTPIIQPLALFYRETPEDFESEVTSPEQMTFAQLRRYIDTIRNSGYAADELAVKLYTKTSWPVISLVMALIALPFAFRVGKRGALYGVGIALVLGIVYWMVFAVFTKFGEVGNLPALLSAWSANVLFAMAAVYLFINVET